MKKTLIPALVLALLLVSPAALAAKARNIATTADSQFHSHHLRAHVQDASCFATGSYIKIRIHPNGAIIGHLEKGDELILHDVRDGWALIEITRIGSYSRDGKVGMKGWVNSDYIDCTCTDQDYFQHPDLARARAKRAVR